MKKVKLSYLYTAVIIFLIFTSCKNNKQENGGLSDIVKTKFVWQGDSLGNFYYSHSNILIPTKIESDKSESARYFILNNGINNNFIFKEYLSSLEKVSANDSVKKISGSTGNIKFGPSKFRIYEKYNNSADSIIGEISLDFFNKKEITIDFKNNSISVSDEIKDYKSLEFVDYTIYLNRKIIIPVIVNGKDSKFLFNPQSALYVYFNPSDSIKKIKIGNKEFSAPQYRKVNDPNPAFSGILGYSFLKDKTVIFRPTSNKIAIR